MDITILQNQVVIMKTLLTLTQEEKFQRELEERIAFTEARIKALS